MAGLSVGRREPISGGRWRRFFGALPLVLVLVLVVTSCGAPSPGIVDPATATDAPADGASASDPTPSPYTAWTNNDRIDLLKLDGTTYAGAASWAGPVEFEEDDLGEEYARIKGRRDPTLSFSSENPDDVAGIDITHLEDSEATGLEPGTPVHAVDGYQPGFAVAAYSYGILHVYKAMFGPDTPNPRLHRGEDLLDVAGRVQRIGVMDHTGYGTWAEAASIRDRVQVDRLVQMALQTRVKWQHLYEEQSRSVPAGSIQNYEVVFKVEDSSGVTLPSVLRTPQFNHALLRALGGRPPELGSSRPEPPCEGAKLDGAGRKWRGSGVASYDLGLETRGLKGEKGKWYLEVRDGTLTRAAHDPTPSNVSLPGDMEEIRDPAKLRRLAGELTVEGLFDLIAEGCARARSQEGSILLASYDPLRGYPVRYALDSGGENVERSVLLLLFRVR